MSDLTAVGAFPVHYLSDVNSARERPHNLCKRRDPLEMIAHFLCRIEVIEQRGSVYVRLRAPEAEIVPVENYQYRKCIKENDFHPFFDFRLTRSFAMSPCVTSILSHGVHFQLSRIPAKFRTSS